MGKEATRVRRRERKNIASGVAHVAASFNNTMITITDAQGNTIAWSSSGTMGFKGSRKSTPYAAQVAAEDAAKKAQEHGMRTLEVEVSGPGSGRESALRSLQGAAVQSVHIDGVLHEFSSIAGVREDVTTMRLGPSPCILMAMSLMLRTMSVTSSRTPAIEENSCSTPSICTD